MIDIPDSLRPVLTRIAAALAASPRNVVYLRDLTGYPYSALSRLLASYAGTLFVRTSRDVYALAPTAQVYLDVPAPPPPPDQARVRPVPRRQDCAAPPRRPPTGTAQRPPKPRRSMDGGPTNPKPKPGAVFAATSALPNTPEKLTILEYRAKNNLPLFHPDDARFPDTDLLEALHMLASGSTRPSSSLRD